MEDTVKNLMAVKPDPKYKEMIDPYARTQPIGMYDMFPSKDGKCACGCKTKLTGRQTRWAKGHNELPYSFYNIIARASRYTIQFYLFQIHGKICQGCGIQVGDVGEDFVRYDVDHIVEVREGGGGRFLENYQILCEPCHKKKTKNTYKKLSGKVESTQIELLL